MSVSSLPVTVNMPANSTPVINSASSFVAVSFSFRSHVCCHFSRFNKLIPQILFYSCSYHVCQINSCFHHHVLVNANVLANWVPVGFICWGSVHSPSPKHLETRIYMYISCYSIFTIGAHHVLVTCTISLATAHSLFLSPYICHVRKTLPPTQCFE